MASVVNGLVMKGLFLTWLLRTQITPLSLRTSCQTPVADGSWAVIMNGPAISIKYSCLDLARDPVLHLFKVPVSHFLLEKGNTHCWQICGVDTSFWMKSFSPIFLSLMKAAGGGKREVYSQCVRGKQKHIRASYVIQIFFCPFNKMFSVTALIRWVCFFF